MFTGLASPSHLIIVLVIILVLFGAKRIPELAKGLGTGIKEFREGVSVSDDSKPEASGIDERRGEGRADSEAGNKNARTDAAERSFYGPCLVSVSRRCCSSGSSYWCSSVLVKSLRWPETSAGS